jgi:hypothetical protein
VCAVLCCAVLCCAVLCCAVLCCAVLCCAVLCCAVLCCAVCGSDLLLCVGDWTFTLWREGLQQPLFRSPATSVPITCGLWSPTRPSVLFIGKVTCARVDNAAARDASLNPQCLCCVSLCVVLHSRTAASTCGTLWTRRTSRR